MNMSQTPKQLGFSMPAEWHTHEACWMAWPRHHETWREIGLQRAQTAYLRVAKAIAQFEPVNMFVHPDDIHYAETVCPSEIELIPLAINDSWTRDTACTFLLRQDGSMAGVDWIHNAWGGNYQDCSLDNKIAEFMIEACAVKGFKADFVMEGGSFHVDGEGTVLTTRECLLNPNRNPHLNQAVIERHLCDYLGAEKVIWLNQGLVGDETDGHIDEIATFIGPARVLALITEDKSDENYHILQENLSILRAARDARGRALEVYTVSLPPATYLNGQRMTLSYINFYLANKGIVMPAFGHAQYDEAAYQLFTTLFPNHQICQIDALDIFAGGGGIHCITQQQPKAMSTYKVMPS